MEVWIPASFWFDHEDRTPVDDPDTQMCTLVKATATRALVHGDAQQIGWLKKDAQFYAEGNVDDCGSLVRSAKRTLAALESAGV